MHSRTSFLSERDRQPFVQAGRLVPRSVVRLSTYDRGRSNQRSIALADVVVGQVSELSILKSHRFRCCCVSVAQDDGMTWAAEAARVAIASQHLGHHVSCLSDATETGGLPVVSEIVGRDRLCRLAAKHGLTKRFWSVRRWVAPTIVVASIGIGAITKVVEILLKRLSGPDSLSSSSVLQSPLTWIVSGALAALSLVTQLVAKRQEADPQSKSIQALRETLDAKPDPDAYASFTDDLAAALKRGPFPRAIVIDNYEAQDRTTKEVLEKYLTAPRDIDGAELWIVFETRTGNRLTPWILNQFTTSPVARSQFSYFELLPLTEGEQRSLLQVLGRSDDAIGAAAIKTLCSDSTLEHSDLHRQIRSWRVQHPRRPQYGPLEFLYLLSLTARPGNLFLWRSFVRSKLVDRTVPLRADLLRRLLPGTRSESDEFDRNFSDVIRQFPTAVISNPDAASLRVTPESAKVLEELADELALPAASLGHLFWAVCWHDIHRQEAEAFWTRKIVYHLARAETRYVAADDLHRAALEQLLHISLSTIEAALAACLFDDTMVLIARIVVLLDDCSVTTEELDRLIVESWTCYALLGESAGDDQVGGTAVTSVEPGTLSRALRACHMRREIAVEERQPESIDPLVRLFVDSLWLSGDEDNDFRTRVAEWLQAEHAAARSYAESRAAWLALTLCPMLVSAGSSEVETALKAATTGLDGLVASLFARLSTSTRVSARGLDLDTLSSTLWCQGLLLAFRDAALDWSRALRNMHASRSAGLADYLLSFSHAPDTRNIHLFELAEMAAQAIAVATDARSTLLRVAPNNDLLSQSLAREVIGTSLTAVLTACHYLHWKGDHQPDEQVIQKISEVFAAASKSLQYDFPRIRTTQDLLSVELVRKVDDLVKLCILVYDTFGLTQLRDVLNLRRVHFDVICRQLQPDDYAGFKSLLDSVEPAIHRKDFVGLVANCVMADCLQSSAELSGHFLRASGELALAGAFGIELKRAFALIVVEKSHVLSFDLSPFVALLLDPDGDQSYLARCFAECPLERVCGFALNFLNAVKHGESRRLAPAVKAVIAKAAETLKPGPERIELLSLLELFGIEEDLNIGAPVDLINRLQKWSDRKNLWLYAWLLDLLITHHHDIPEVRDEADALFHGRDPRKDHFNSYYLLAAHLADALAATGKPTDVVALYLKNGVKQWEGISTAEANMRVYMLLTQFFPSDAQPYREEVVKWQSILLHREHLRRLPDLAKEGRFFVIFREYCRWMQFWGLSTDLTRDEYARKSKVPPELAAKTVGQWRSNGAIVPDALLLHGNDRVVSAEFLIVGSLLFSQPLASDSVYAGERYNFNEMARANLRPLLRLVTALPNLPTSIRDLLVVYSQRLYSVAAPNKAERVA